MCVCVCVCVCLGQFFVFIEIFINISQSLCSIHLILNIKILYDKFNHIVLFPPPTILVMLPLMVSRQISLQDFHCDTDLLLLPSLQYASCLYGVELGIRYTKALRIIVGQTL